MQVDPVACRKAVSDAGRNPAFRAFTRSVPFNARLAAGELATCASLLEALAGIVAEGALSFMQARVALLRARLDLARGSVEHALQALRVLGERDDLEVEDAGEVRLAVALALESLDRLERQRPAASATVELMRALADAEAAAGNGVVAEQLRDDAEALLERLRASLGARESVATSSQA